MMLGLYQAQGQMQYPNQMMQMPAWPYQVMQYPQGQMLQYPGQYLPSPEQIDTSQSGSVGMPINQVTQGKSKKKTSKPSSSSGQGQSNQ